MNETVKDFEVWAQSANRGWDKYALQKALNLQIYSKNSFETNQSTFMIAIT
jgi:hypothetical protein